VTGRSARRFAPALARSACAAALAVALAAGPALAQAPKAADSDAAKAAAATPLPADAGWMDRASAWFDHAWSMDWWPWRDTAPPPHIGVQAPHYGDSLFYFFQGRYFTSVTGLMVSQQFQRMGQHDDEAEILRGGLYLSYGMHREAGNVFAALIERNAPPPVRDRAWFYLAKIRYQRGLSAEALDALGRIDKALPGALQEDRGLLQANALMALGRYDEASRVLDLLAKGGVASSYARYNLGVALIRSGDVQRGSEQLDGVGRMPAATDEYRSLRDKANVALGYAALQQGKGAEARTYLQRVRLEGMYSNNALLGFGWAAANQGQMKSALVPWSELAGRGTNDAAVLEAKLAVPYALTDLGAHSQALVLYRDAIAAFDKQSAALDAAVAAIRSGKLLDGLVAGNPGDEMGWFWTIADLPDVQGLPLNAHLAQLIATHPFQESFKNYRDLLFLERNLRQWQDNLGVLRDMLANRSAGYAQRLPQIRSREDALNLTGMRQRADALQAELARVERDVDVAALATARERELQQRLDRVRATLESGGDAPEFAQARERYRRAAGALLWQQNEAYAQRLWNARKGMQALLADLERTQDLDAALAAAQRDEPARLDAFAHRLDALAARVDVELPRVAGLAQQQQVALQEMAVAELLRQKERLAEYGTQARFAVAQIVDRAALGNDAKDAPAAQGGVRAPR